MKSLTGTVWSVMVLTLGLTACSTDDGTAPAPSPSSTLSSPSSSTAAAVPAPPSGVPVVDVDRTLAIGLRVPWGVAFLPDGSALVAERPTGGVVRIGKDGGSTPAGTVPGVRDQGEGGLLGLTVRPGDGADGAGGSVFAYLTSTEGDNRVVRMSWDGARLGSPAPILTGIPSAGIHNGGLLTVGPDGKLWIGTGEAGRRSPAQDRNDLGGKILRIDLDGSVPADNPFAGSPVYSLGHRNVQGLAFDSRRQPWAVEFGQNTWDELNRIVPGGNYGWPVVEGQVAHAGFIEPLVQWPTSDASPSGMAIVDDVAYIGALRGRRLWQVPLEGDRTGKPRAWFEARFGRIRNVAAVPGGGALWITTSNRDGRGEPGRDDDRVVRLTLGPPAR